MHLKAMENPTIDVNETTRINECQSLPLDFVKEFIKNPKNLHSTDFSEGFNLIMPDINHTPEKIIIRDLLRFLGSIKKSILNGTCLWLITENNDAIGYIQLTTNNNSSSAQLLIAMEQHSLKNNLDIQLCNTIVNHCFEKYTFLEYLEARIDSRDSKFENMITACGFIKKSTQQEQDRVINVFAKTRNDSN